MPSFCSSRNRSHGSRGSSPADTARSNFVLVPRAGEPRSFIRNVEDYYFGRTSVFAEREHWNDGTTRWRPAPD